MLYISAIALSFFLAFLLFTKKNKATADHILFAWLSIIGFHLLTAYILLSGQFISYPTLASLGFSLPLAHGPFLYLYTRQQTTIIPFNKKQLLHFFPVLLSYCLFAKFYLLTPEQKVEVLRLKGQGFEIQRVINMYSVYLSGIIYVVLSLNRLLKYKKSIVHRFSNTEKINFDWLLYLILWIVVIWLVVLFIGGDKAVFAAVSVFVIWLGYFGIKQVQVFSQVNTMVQEESTVVETLQAKSLSNEISECVIESVGQEIVIQESVKYQKSLLSDQDATNIHERLKLFLDSDKPFKNPDLILNELAKELDVHPNLLSQVINSKEKKNFYDLINERRVQEFTKLVADPSNKQFTLLALAFDCGFNSKASFNRNFKKHTGKTPSEYLKTNLSKQEFKES